ncbi:hypothetical protein GN958_ATG22565 [Phytophthora infestans]|uniref:Uncharacterized protein n=1 Tax=Phytophthora infestans TaxID=4787 RepID=A0A8S9TJU8_PHYIN|nr:hypothetical protein GN958_ATG22565 [Phytophthora infestans]
MRLASLLREPATTDKQLFRLAKAVGIRNVAISWLQNYDPNHKGPQVINLGSPRMGGTHWVAVYRDHYFDPLGMPPPSVKDLDEKQWTTIDVQKSSYGHCGQYCIYFLWHAIRNDVDGFYSDFDAYDIT